MNMLRIIKDLFNMPRSITGEPIKKTLNYIKNEVSNLKILKFKSGTKVFDWVVPNEWNINDAYIKNSKGKKILNFKKNYLNIVYHSTPIKRWISKKDLLKRIHYDDTIPSAVPYVTSYYKKYWGFCMTKNQVKKLSEKKYFVHIDSSFKKGNLVMGEYLKKGNQKKEIFFSTYICHPSMANDNIASTALQIEIIKYLNKNYRNSKYTYRFIFLPETIGSICYLSKRLKILKKNMLLGFAISCVGDNKQYSIINSRYGNRLSDTALYSVLKNKKNLKIYSYLDRGSDERQYCYPGIDLPVSGFCRSRFHTFKEYHTDHDNLDYISKEGLNNSFKVFRNIIDALESKNFYPKNKFLCEPNLGKRGLMSTIGKKFKGKNKVTKNFLAYSDGTKNLFEICDIINIDLEDALIISKKLNEKKLI